MEPAAPGDLVTVATRGPQLDAIVFDVPSSAKTVVAMIDPTRGPVLRTVDPKTLAARSEAGPDDETLQRLIRRTPPVVRGAASGKAGAGPGRGGHKPASMHRTTGK